MIINVKTIITDINHRFHQSLRHPILLNNLKLFRITIKSYGKLTIKRLKIQLQSSYFKFTP